MSEIKKKGIYLIQEKGVLNSKTGAFQHIAMGVAQLSKSFDTSLYISNVKIKLKDYTNNEKGSTSIKTTKVKNAFYGTIKDLYLLFSNFRDLFKLIKLYKRGQLDFVYERVSYLNFSGLIACRYLGIPHFYEANGFQYKGRSRYYKSFFVSIAKFLEKTSYKYATHTFFVGSYGDYWKINKKNWTNVENGVENHIINNKEFKTRQEKRTIQVCFVGRLMDHQKIEVLIEALKLFEEKSNIEFNLIGSGLELVEKEINDIGIKVVNHGFVNRSMIITLISHFDIAIISGSNTYQSCMKLFDYGAGGCAVIAPEIHNLKLWFSNELLFFNGSSKDLSMKLNFLVKNTNQISNYGEKLQNKIKNNFTWKIIFDKKIKIIKEKIC